MGSAPRMAVFIATAIAIVPVLASLAAGCADESTPAASPSSTAAKVEEEPAPPVVSDFPCEIQRIFATHCWRCHGSALRYGTLLRLTTRADLLAPATSRSPSGRIADRVVVRIYADAYPMPPRAQPRVPADDRDVVAGWVAAGLSLGEGGGCDGGAPGD